MVSFKEPPKPPNPFKNMNKHSRYAIIAAVGIIVIAVLIAIGIGIGQNNANTTTEDTNNPEDKESITQVHAIPDAENQPILGDDTAPVQISVFSDYMCPACYGWEQEILPELQDTFINNGDAYLVKYNTPVVSPLSGQTAMAAESVYENNNIDTFWEFHSMMFEAAHDEANQNNNQSEQRTMYENIASDLNLNEAAFITDIEKETYSDNVDTDMDIAQEYGIMATPTIIINDVYIHDPFDIDVLKHTIKNEIK